MLELVRKPLTNIQSFTSKNLLPLKGIIYTRKGLKKHDVQSSLRGNCETIETRCQPDVCYLDVTFFWKFLTYQSPRVSARPRNKITTQGANKNTHKKEKTTRN